MRNNIKSKTIKCKHCNKPFIVVEGLSIEIEDQPCPHCLKDANGKKHFIKNKYETFVDDCYDNCLNLIEEMKKEIRNNILDFCGGNISLEGCVDDIMDLISEMKYEW